MTRDITLGVSACLLLAAGAFAQPVVFTEWNFNSLPSGQIVNNPAPSTGHGTAVPLGMANNYLYYTSPQRTGSQTACDITSSGASSDSASSPNNCWRVRGSFDGTLANAGVGYSIFAPQFTQGAEFDISTVNYSGIVFTFDWFTTNQGVHDMQVQYSIDGGANWLNIGPLLLSATNGWRNNQTVDFSALAGVDDNPQFRVRLVTVFDPTYSGPGSPTYTGASGGQYNNASGNWRFDKVAFHGTAIRAVAPTCSGSVNPPAACASGGPLTFTVAVESGAGPASTGLAVTADLSNIGLSSNQAFFDDGSNGDAIAGDGVFTFAATVPAGRLLGSTSISATVTDAQSRSGSTTIPVIIGDCSGNSTSRIVISQVFGGGGNLGAIPAEDAPYDADYVELYNRSNQVVNIDGWSVQYASPGSAGGFDNVEDQVQLSGNVQPGQYVLIRMSDPVPGFNPLPADFAQLPGFGGVGNTGGRVALVRSIALIGTDFNNSNIEDFVGYGSRTITFEGAAPAPTPNPPNNRANLRAQAGAQDTQQNFNDFVIGSPNPRNRSVGFLAGYASIDVDAACTGTDVLLAVAVSGGGPGVHVNADVSSIVGSTANVALYDDGTHGDTQASDGVFSLSYTVPPDAAQGNRVVLFTVSDQQGHSDTSALPLSVAVCTPSSAPVVISQVYGGGGNNFSGFNGDFAEIFNRSASPVDLTGWSFQSARVTDLGFDSRIALLSGVINPGEYRLIVTNLPSATGAVLPTADFVPSTLFGMESSFGRVALVSSTALLGTDYSRSDVVDLVGYGSLAQSFEGVRPTGTLGDIFVAVRKEGGCQDFNQNVVDFDVVLALALPHGSASPASPCAVPTCPADFNGDSFVNPDDLSDFITCFFLQVQIPGVCSAADFNDDGFVNPDDLSDFITTFFLAVQFGC